MANKQYVVLSISLDIGQFYAIDWYFFDKVRKFELLKNFIVDDGSLRQWWGKKETKEEEKEAFQVEVCL